MSATTGERQLLAHGLAELQRRTGTPVVFAGLAAHGVIPVQETRGTRTDALLGVPVRVGTGLGGKVAAYGRPLAVSDYLSERNISHEYDLVVAREGLRAMAAVPIVVQRSVGGVMYLALRQPGQIGERALTSAMAVARRVGYELAVAREVERRLRSLRVEMAERDTGAIAVREELREAYADVRALAVTVDNPEVAARLDAIGARLAWATRGADAQAQAVQLSPRELDVLALVATGCRNADVAERLGLAVETVKCYMRSASRKLGAHGRTEAVVLARRAGLLP